MITGYIPFNANGIKIMKSSQLLNTKRKNKDTRRETIDTKIKGTDRPEEDSGKYGIHIHYISVPETIA